MTKAFSRGVDAVGIHRDDNVATLLRDARAGEVLRIAIGDVTVTVTCNEAIRLCHKIAIAAVNPGHDIIKYGEVIGKAYKPITAGDHVHIHNMRSCRGVSVDP